MKLNKNGVIIPKTQTEKDLDKQKKLQENKSKEEKQEKGMKLVYRPNPEGIELQTATKWE